MAEHKKSQKGSNKGTAAANRVKNMRSRPLEPGQKLALKHTDEFDDDDEDMGPPKPKPGKKTEKKSKKELTIPTPPIRETRDYMAFSRTITGYNQPEHYVKYNGATGAGNLTQLESYDLLKDDLEWLAGFNNDMANGTMTLSSGMMGMMSVHSAAHTSAAAAHSAASASAGSTSTGVGSNLTSPNSPNANNPKQKALEEEEMELIIDTFEKECAKLTRTADPHREFPSTMAVQLARRKLAAMKKNKNLTGKGVCVQAVYEYWVKKRQMLRKPLMRCFQPAPFSPGPQVAFVERQKEGRRFSTRNPKKNDQESLEKMKYLVNDFESLRKICELVIQRETYKKESILLATEVYDQQLADTPFGRKYQPARELLLAKRGVAVGAASSSSPGANANAAAIAITTPGSNTNNSNSNPNPNSSIKIEPLPEVTNPPSPFPASVSDDLHGGSSNVLVPGSAGSYVVYAKPTPMGELYETQQLKMHLEGLTPEERIADLLKSSLPVSNDQLFSESSKAVSVRKKKTPKKSTVSDQTRKTKEKKDRDRLETDGATAPARKHTKKQAQPREELASAEAKTLPAEDEDEYEVVAEESSTDEEFSPDMLSEVEDYLDDVEEDMLRKQFPLLHIKSETTAIAPATGPNGALYANGFWEQKDAYAASSSPPLYFNSGVYAYGSPNPAFGGLSEFEEYNMMLNSSATAAHAGSQSQSTAASASASSHDTDMTSSSTAQPSGSDKSDVAAAGHDKDPPLVEMVTPKSEPGSASGGSSSASESASSAKLQQQQLHQQQQQHRTSVPLYHHSFYPYSANLTSLYPSSYAPEIGPSPFIYSYSPSENAWITDFKIDPAPAAPTQSSTSPAYPTGSKVPAGKEFASSTSPFYSLAGASLHDFKDVKVKEESENVSPLKPQKTNSGSGYNDSLAAAAMANASTPTASQLVEMALHDESIMNKLLAASAVLPPTKLDAPLTQQQQFQMYSLRRRVKQPPPPMFRHRVSQQRVGREDRQLVDVFAESSEHDHDSHPIIVKARQLAHEREQLQLQLAQQQQQLLMQQLQQQQQRLATSAAASGVLPDTNPLARSLTRATEGLNTGPASSTISPSLALALGSSQSSLAPGSTPYPNRTQQAATSSAASYYSGSSGMNTASYFSTTMPGTSQNSASSVPPSVQPTQPAGPVGVGNSLQKYRDAHSQSPSSFLTSAPIQSSGVMKSPVRTTSSSAPSSVNTSITGRYSDPTVNMSSFSSLGATSYLPTSVPPSYTPSPSTSPFPPTQYVPRSRTSNSNSANPMMRSSLNMQMYGGGSAGKMSASYDISNMNVNAGMVTGAPFAYEQSALHASAGAPSHYSANSGAPGMTMNPSSVMYETPFSTAADGSSVNMYGLQYGYDYSQFAGAASTAGSFAGGVMYPTSMMTGSDYSSYPATAPQGQLPQPK